MHTVEYGVERKAPTTIFLNNIMFLFGFFPAIFTDMILSV